MSNTTGELIFGIHAIEMLLDLGMVVICSGGGGIRMTPAPG